MQSKVLYQNDPGSNGSGNLVGLGLDSCFYVHAAPRIHLGNVERDDVGRDVTIRNTEGTLL